MLKRKLLIIALLIILLISLVIPVVNAANGEKNSGEDENVQTELLNEVNSGDTENHSSETKEPTSNSLEKKDVYIMEPGDIVIDYVVDGNLFVIANSVTINSQVGGDAFICANKVNIDNQGYIFSNLFVCCNELNVSGVIYDLYNISQNTTITGYIYRDVHSATNTLNLDGTIGRNAYVSAENINFAKSENNEDESVSTSSTMIYGDLHFDSPNNIDIPNTTVAGNVVHSSTSSNTILNYIWDLGTFIATVLIIWLLMLWLAPKFLVKTDYLVSKKILPSLGFGILATLSIIVGAIILLIVGLTTKVALLGFGLLMLLLGIGLPVFTISLSKFICKKLKNEKIIVTLGVLILTSIVIWLTILIPFAGGIINLVIKLIGLGIIVNYVLQSRKKDTANNTEIIEENK